ncbi:MAG: beta-lactamase family protein [Bacteroidales bacterium]|nr:beta-lactamase family protein [Bacteroidales bacterium]
MRSFASILLVCVAVIAISCNSSKQEVPQMPEQPVAPAPEPDAGVELESIMKRYNAVGLAVAVVDGGKIVYTDTFGYKDLEAKKPWEGKDVLRIASISKSFVATGILQLVEQGKLSLDDDVSELMGLRVRNPKYPEHAITVRMLLSHTSSLSDSNGYFTLESLNDRAWNSYEPGSKYQYCNLGYNTLGAIIEKVSGVRFDQYIYDNILNPLGLYANHNVHELDPERFVKIYKYNASNSSYTCSDAYSSIEAQLAEYRMGYSTPLFSPTGGLKISVSDLAKVMMMHMNGGTLDGVKILGSASCTLMQSEIVPTNYEGEKYGMAMLRTNDLLKGHRLVGHDGLALGAHTAMFWHPERKFGFVIMTNGCNAVTDKVFANILCESAECLYRNFID